MKERSFDEMIAHFNRRVADMDISQDCKMELLVMVTALGYKHEKSTQQWIPCSERLPEEHEWIGTKKFGTTISDEVYVTFENPKGERFTKHLRFQNGKLANFEQRNIDVFYKGSVPIAWMPLPKPWKGEEECLETK